MRHYWEIVDLPRMHGVLVWCGVVWVVLAWCGVMLVWDGADMASASVSVLALLWG